MKKLIFSALIAVAAIGGAVSSANAQYLFGSNTRIPCFFTPDPSCAIALGLPPWTPVFDAPANPGPQTQIGILAEYTFSGE